MKVAAYVLLVFLSLPLCITGCKKKDLVACETDQECTDMLYGRWKRKLGASNGNWPGFDFNQDMTYRELNWNSDSEVWEIKNPQDTFYFEVNNKVIELSRTNGTLFDSWTIIHLYKDELGFKNGGARFKKEN